MKKQVEKFGKKVLFTSRVIVASFAQGGESGQIFDQRFDKKTVESLFKSFVYFHLL